MKIEGLYQGNNSLLTTRTVALFLAVALALAGPWYALLLAPSVATAQPSTANDNTWVTDGVLNSVVNNGTTTYIGGIFNYVGPHTGCGVPIDEASGSPEPVYPKVNAPIYAAAPDGAGGWYIGGSFTAVGSYARDLIAHIMPDGTVDLAWDPDANGRVRSILVDGSTVYVGGEFTGIGGAARGYIAALDASTGTATAWNPNADNHVWTLAMNGTTVYAGGDFTSIGGAARNRIAAIDASTGTATAWNPNSNDTVHTITTDGTTVFAGGRFTSIGVQARNYIAAIDAGGSATAWDPSANDWVFGLLLDGTTIYVGGDFATIGGQPRSYLAAIDTATGNATVWNPSPDSYVRAIVKIGSSVYIGGDFTAVGATPRQRIAAIDSATGTPTDWDPRANFWVSVLSVSGGVVYAGGSFTTVGEQQRNNVAAIDALTGSLKPWDPNANDWVSCLLVAGNTVYVGGSFTNIGGAARNRIAAIDATTGNATAWDPNAGGAVESFAISGQTLYAGGVFPTIGVDPRNCIAAIDTSTGNATAWDPGADSNVYALAVSGNTVYAGGLFSAIGGSPRSRIAAIDATTGNATTWDPGADNEVRAIAVGGSVIYAGGSFSNIGVDPRNCIAAIDASTGNATAWDPNLNGAVRAIDIEGTTVYAGGNFSSVGGSIRFFAAGIDSATGSPTAWNPTFDNPVYTIDVNGQAVYAGGVFSAAGGNPYWYYRSYFAQFGYPAPQIDYMSPSSGNYNQIVWLSGSNFGSDQGTSYVSFGSVQATWYAQWTDDDILVYVPAGASGIVPVTVTTVGGTSNPQEFSVTPEITNIEPSSGNVGTEVTLNGSGFGPTRGTSYVSFGAVQATSYPSWSDTQVKCRVPTGASGQVLVTLTTAGGTSNSALFAVTPLISTIGPACGTEGTEVTIGGSGFGPTRGTSYVSFGAVQATSYPSWSDTQVKCRVPRAAAGTMQVTVTTPAGTSNSKPFTVTTPTWYLAEGTSDWGFDTYVTIQNPNEEQLTAEVTYMTKSGPVERADITLPATSQTVINPRNDLGSTDFSTRVSCKEGKTIAVDRRMIWTGTGASSPEGHASVGVTFPAKTWYLPEGSSQWGFETWLLIQNPNSSDASCTVTYMIEGASPVVKTKSVPANSRQSFSMSEDIGAADASIKVTSNVAVIPERSMYRNNKREGHDSIGTTTAASDYFLAEGTTAWGFTTWVLIQNPGSSASDVTITYMTPSGKQEQPSFSLPGNSRKTIKVNDVAGMGATDFSTQVHGSQPIIAERAMYWDNGTGEACHDSIGMDQAHNTFYLPDGETYNGMETWTLVQNPNDSDVQVEISYLTPSGTDNVVFNDTVPANSRKSYNMSEKIPAGRAAIMVTSKTSGKKIMCERAMYWNSRGAGTDTIGGYSE